MVRRDGAVADDIVVDYELDDTALAVEMKRDGIALSGNTPASSGWDSSLLPSVVLVYRVEAGVTHPGQTRRECRDREDARRLFEGYIH